MYEEQATARRFCHKCRAVIPKGEWCLVSYTYSFRGSAYKNREQWCKACLKAVIDMPPGPPARPHYPSDQTQAERRRLRRRREVILPESQDENFEV